MLKQFGFWLLGRFNDCSCNIQLKKDIWHRKWFCWFNVPPTQKGRRAPSLRYRASGRWGSNQRPLDSEWNARFLVPCANHWATEDGPLTFDIEVAQLSYGLNHVNYIRENSVRTKPHIDKSHTIKSFGSEYGFVLKQFLINCLNQNMSWIKSEIMFYLSNVESDHSCMAYSWT